MEWKSEQTSVLKCFIFQLPGVNLYSPLLRQIFASWVDSSLLRLQQVGSQLLAEWHKPLSLGHSRRKEVVVQ